MTSSYFGCESRSSASPRHLADLSDYKSSSVRKRRDEEIIPNMQWPDDLLPVPDTLARIKKNPTTSQSCTSLAIGCTPWILAYVVDIVGKQMIK